MAAPVSPKKGHNHESFFRLLFLTLQHINIVAVFAAGITIGMTLNNCGPNHDTIQLHEQLQISSQRKIDDGDGWKTINVFYGSVEYFESLLPNEHKFYSQARQDEVVLSLLKNKTNGFFVDLASNDAAILSNSYALEKHYGWKGLCIEPNPAYWYNLTHVRKNCEIIGAVVGQNRMDQVDFKFNGLEHGGIVGKGFDNGSHLKYSSSKEYTVTLSEIFRKFEVPRVIDYLSLDVEGAEEFIMTKFPLTDYRIRIMTIERPKEKLRNHLESHGYVQILRLSRWGETLWIHSSYESEMDTTNLQEFHGKKQYEEQKARKQKLNTYST